MSRLLLIIFILTVGCQTKTINSELRPLLVDHLNNKLSYNLAVEQPNGKVILQFIQESTEVQHISIVLDPNINNLKTHSTKIESLLTKCGFEYYYGSSNNFLYADFSNDQIDQLMNFTELFFEAEFIDTRKSDLHYSLGLFDEKGERYSSESKNLL